MAFSGRPRREPSRTWPDSSEHNVSDGGVFNHPTSGADSLEMCLAPSQSLSGEAGCQNPSWIRAVRAHLPVSVASLVLRGLGGSRLLLGDYFLWFLLHDLCSASAQRDLHWPKKNSNLETCLQFCRSECLESKLMHRLPGTSYHPHPYSPDEQRFEVRFPISETEPERLSC